MDRTHTLLHIVENIATVACWVDPRYRYVAFTPAYRESMRARYGGEISIGESVLRLIENPDERAVAQDLLDQALGGRTVVETGVRAEGSPEERHFEATFMPMPGADGSIDGVFIFARDITAAHQMEARLWRRERQLAQSQRVANLGHWYSRLPSGTVRFSGQGLEMLRALGGSDEFRTPEDLRDLLRRVVHPEDRAQVEQLITGRVPREPVDFEFRVLDLAGEVRHLRGRMELVDDPDGGEGLIGVFQDDTPQWALERDHRRLFETMREGFGYCRVLRDPQGRVVDWVGEMANPALAHILGVASLDRGARASELTPVLAGDPRLLDMLDRVSRGGEPESFDAPSPSGDGTIRVWLRAADPDCFTVFIQDITDQRRTEESLARTASRLHRALTAAKAGVWEWYPDTDRGVWSDELYDLYGVDHDHGTDGDEWMRIVHPQDRDTATRAFEEAARRGTELLGEWRLATRDGSERWMLSRGLPESAEDGRVVRYVGVDIDITERKAAMDEVGRLNSQLAERVHELAAANEDLDDLLYSLAHDLRSPLRAIDGFSLAFAEDHLDSTDEQGAEQIGRVRAAAGRLGDLFDAALELAKVGRAELDVVEVDLTELATEVVAPLREGRPDRRTEVIVAPGMTAATDPALARVIFEQLLANAWDATEEREPGRVEVGSTVVEGEHRFFVSDDGVGFDQSYAAKIFVAYQQLEPPGPGRGTGTGLTMVRRAADRLGGRVWARSEPGRGATFWFTLGAAGSGAGTSA